MPRDGEPHDPSQCGCIAHNPRPRGANTDDVRTRGDWMLTSVLLLAAFGVPIIIAIIGGTQ